jgi:hypothetical protein
LPLGNITYLRGEYDIFKYCIIMVCPQVHKMEAELGHKLFPPNALMKVLHFNVLTSCPKDELHQWFIGLYGEHIIPAIVHRYTKVLVAKTERIRRQSRTPGLKRPGALKKPRRPGSVQLTRYDKHIPGIYLSYVPTQ